MGKFLKFLVGVLKGVVSLVLLAYLIGAYFPLSTSRLTNTVSFLYLLLVLFTLFWFWLKKKTMERHPGFAKPWKVMRIVGIILWVVFFVLLAWGIPKYVNQQKTQSTVDIINNKKITLFDVFGNNLPPKPDQTANDSTVEGIDANHNGIRDDVELAIFAQYPNSAKIRAAELQYAQALQLELTQVYNSETLVATLKKEDLAYGCLADIDYDKLDNHKNEIRSLVINTDLRRKKFNDIYNYMTGYGLDNGPNCNIDSSTLPN